MAKYNHNGDALKNRRTVRFSDKDMNYLDFMSEERGIKVSELIRETIREDLIHRKMIRFYPPTEQIDERLSEIATRMGVNRQQVITNIVLFHMFIIDMDILTEELIALMIANVDAAKDQE